MSAVTVWSKPSCVQCTAVKRAFDKAGVDYEEMDLTKHPEQVERFKEQNLASAPIVLAAGHEPFAGFQPDAVKAIVAEYGTPAAA